APIAGAKVSPGTTQAQAPTPTAGVQQGGQMVLPQPDGKVTQLAVKPTNIYIQAGAFLRQANANQLTGQLKKFGPVRVSPVTVGAQRYYRVRVGPIASVQQADDTLKRMISGGHPESRIVVD